VYQGNEGVLSPVSDTDITPSSESYYILLSTHFCTCTGLPFRKVTSTLYCAPHGKWILVSMLVKLPDPLHCFTYCLKPWQKHESDMNWIKKTKYGQISRPITEALSYLTSSIGWNYSSGHVLTTQPRDCTPRMPIEVKRTSFQRTSYCACVRLCVSRISDHIIRLSRTNEIWWLARQHSLTCCMWDLGGCTPATEWNPQIILIGFWCHTASE
jgi:hypothetical protein